jgi:hypothetical protein
VSFFDEAAKFASEAFGGVPPEATAQAASDHISSMDDGQLAGHLQQSVGTMDQSSLVSLGQHLLQTIENRGGDAAQAAQQAGTSQEEAASGSPGAISALFDYAKNNQGMLQEAGQAFVQRNPGAIAQLAPSFLQGIMVRLGGSGSSGG